MHAHMEYDCYSHNVYDWLGSASEYAAYLERSCIVTFTPSLEHSTIHWGSGNKEGLKVGLEILENQFKQATF